MNLRLYSSINENSVFYMFINFGPPQSQDARRKWSNMHTWYTLYKNVANVFVLVIHLEQCLALYKPQYWRTRSTVYVFVSVYPLKQTLQFVLPGGRAAACACFVCGDCPKDNIKKVETFYVQFSTVSSNIKLWIFFCMLLISILWYVDLKFGILKIFVTSQQ